MNSFKFFTYGASLYKQLKIILNHKVYFPFFNFILILFLIYLFLFYILFLWGFFFYPIFLFELYDIFFFNLNFNYFKLDFLVSSLNFLNFYDIKVYRHFLDFWGTTETFSFLKFPYFDNLYITNIIIDSKLINWFYSCKFYAPFPHGDLNWYFPYGDLGLIEPKPTPFFVDLLSADLSYNNFLLLPMEFHYQEDYTFFEKVLIFFFPKAVKILNPYNTNDFHFFGNITYITSKVSIDDFFSLDESIYKFFVTKKDLRNQFFCILSYKLISLVDFKDCWWYLFIIKASKFYDILDIKQIYIKFYRAFDLTIELPFIFFLKKAYYHNFDEQSSLSFFIILIVIFAFLSNFYGLLLFLPSFIYSILKSFFLLFSNFFSFFNHLFWGYYRLEENEEGEYIFYSRPDAYYNSTNTNYHGHEEVHQANSVREMEEWDSHFDMYIVGLVIHQP